MGTRKISNDKHIMENQVIKGSTGRDCIFPANLDGLAAAFNRRNVPPDIVVIVGAGISTAAGIPDFRSAGTGIYATYQKYFSYNDPAPSMAWDIFTEDYFYNKSKRPLMRLWTEFLQKGPYEPTASHRLLKKISDTGLLRRIYTQNIDGLEYKADIDADFVIAPHGNFYTYVCENCGKKGNAMEIIDDIAVGNPRCPVCAGEVRPFVVLIGEEIVDADRFLMNAALDMSKCNVLFIMGTSMVVSPINEMLGSAYGLPSLSLKVVVNKNSILHRLPARHKKCTLELLGDAEATASKIAALMESLPVCYVCGKHTDKGCEDCLCVYYCSVDCQRTDFDVHERACPILREVRQTIESVAVKRTHEGEEPEERPTRRAKFEGTKLAELPMEVWHAIFEFLEEKSIGMLTQVSKVLAAAANDPIFVRRVVLKRYTMDTLKRDALISPLIEEGKWKIILRYFAAAVVAWERLPTYISSKRELYIRNLIPTYAEGPVNIKAVALHPKGMIYLANQDILFWAEIDKPGEDPSYQMVFWSNLLEINLGYASSIKMQVVGNNLVVICTILVEMDTKVVILVFDVSSRAPVLSGQWQTVTGPLDKGHLSAITAEYVFIVSGEYQQPEDFDLWPSLQLEFHQTTGEALQKMTRWLVLFSIASGREVMRLRLSISMRGLHSDDFGLLETTPVPMLAVRDHIIRPTMDEKLIDVFKLPMPEHVSPSGMMSGRYVAVIGEGKRIAQKTPTSPDSGELVSFPGMFLEYTISKNGKVGKPTICKPSFVIHGRGMGNMIENGIRSVGWLSGDMWESEYARNVRIHSPIGQDTKMALYIKKRRWKGTVQFFVVFVSKYGEVSIPTGYSETTGGNAQLTDILAFDGTRLVFGLKDVLTKMASIHIVDVRRAITERFGVRRS
jgi:NAD-dependent SIR2 family protein deacetylase